MASKKSNGFMEFTMEWKGKQKGEISLQTAINHTGKLWSNMTNQQRGPYNERAKKGSRFAERELHSCSGLPLSQINREIEFAKNRELQMHRYIDNLIRRSLNKNELQQQSFYFIMFNYFTKTLGGGQYMPAEVALVRYSLKEGNTDLYSTLLNPGNEIFGNSYDAMSHSESTHQLPLPPNAMGKKNMARVYCELLQFLENGTIKNDTREALPPVYTFNEHMPVIESCLNYLNEFAPEEPQLSVYSIHYLFYKLKCGTCEMAAIAPPKSIYITDAQFNRDFFEYQNGIACKYHEEIDRSKYCAQSRVVRWTYTFSDYMCKDLGVEMMPERHFPKKINASFLVNEPNRTDSTWNTSIATSKFKSAASSIGASVRDDDGDNDVESNSSRIGALSLSNTVSTGDTSSIRPTNVWKPKIVSTDFESDINGHEFPALSRNNKKSKKPDNRNGHALRSNACPITSAWKLPQREPTAADFNITQNGSDTLSDLSISSSFVSGRGRGRATNLKTTPSSVKSKNSLHGTARN